MVSAGPVFAKCPLLVRSACRMEWAGREGRMRLEIQIGHPVDQVEETKRSGEEDASVWVYFGDADVQPAVPPGSGAAVFETAEEAGAVLPVQTLVAVLLVSLLHVCGVVHLDGRGRARADVYRGCLLLTGKTWVSRQQAQNDIMKDVSDRAGGLIWAAVFSFAVSTMSLSPVNQWVAPSARERTNFNVRQTHRPISTSAGGN